MLSRPLSLLAVLSTVSGLAAISGCVADRSVPEEGAEARAEAAAQAEADAEAHREERLRGPVGAVIRAAREEAELTAAQRERVDAVAEDMRALRAERHATHRRMRQSAAAIVRAGSADTERFRRAVDAAVGVIEERVQASSDALVELHGILDVEQRGLVADRLQERLDEHRRRHERHHERRHERRGRFGKLAGKLALSAMQIDQLKRMRDEIREQLVGEHQRVRPRHEEIEALIDAFRTEGFERSLDSFQAERLERVRGNIGTVGEHTDTVLGLLTEDQRYLLADAIEIGPEAMGWTEPPNAPDVRR